jgi:Domain of unknown function (DUF4328)
MSYYQDPVPQHPNPYAAYPYQNSRVPRGLAVASAILAGVVTVVQIGAALTASSAADDYAQASREGRAALDVFTAYDAVTILQFPALLAAYIVTCVWLLKSRNLIEHRVPEFVHKRSKVWIWLGWWVPIVSLWFPLQVVRDIRRGSVGHPRGAGILAGWWAFWLIYQIGYQIPSAMTTSTELTDPSTFDALPWVEGINTLAVVVALACWLGIIRQITRGQEALLAAPAGSAPTGF